MANSWPLKFPQVNVGKFIRGYTGSGGQMDQDFVGQRYNLIIEIMIVNVD